MADLDPATNWTTAPSATPLDDIREMVRRMREQSVSLRLPPPDPWRDFYLARAMRFAGFSEAEIEVNIAALYH